jgi:hypothetical protein
MQTDAGAIKILDKFFNTGNNLTLKLFTNDYTPVEGTVVGDLTEAAGADYAAKTLTAGSWTCSSVGGIATAVYAEQTWTFTGALTGPQTVYGYYVIDSTGALIFLQRVDSPATPALNGDKIVITPTYLLSKGTPT